MITRNHSVSTDTKTFSNYLHNDSYLFTYNQKFINLMDVGYENGPLHYLEFGQKKKIFRKIKFFYKKTRNSEHLLHKILLGNKYI